MKNRLYYLHILTLLMLTFFSHSCSKSKKEATSSTYQPKDALPIVEFDYVKSDKFEELLPIVGQTVITKLKLKDFHSSGFISKIYVANNDTVKKGQLILEIEDTNLELEILRLKDEYSTKRKLYEIEMGQRINEADSINLKLYYGLNYLENSINFLSEKKKQLQWRSPSNGIVLLNQNVRVGSQVSSIGDLVGVHLFDKAYIRSFIPNIYANRVHIGQSLVTQKNDTLHIKEINPVESKDNFIEIHIQYDSKLKLRNGEQVLMNLIVTQYANAPVVPISALLKRNNDYLVFIISASDSIAKWIPLTQVRYNDTHAYSPVLLDYIDEMVAINNHFNLTHFQKVVPSHKVLNSNEFDF